MADSVVTVSTASVQPCIPLGDEGAPPAGPSGTARLLAYLVRLHGDVQDLV
jgi:hypothetical protein